MKIPNLSRVMELDLAVVRATVGSSLDRKRNQWNQNHTCKTDAATILLVK